MRTASLLAFSLFLGAAHSAVAQPRRPVAPPPAAAVEEMLPIGSTLPSNTPPLLDVKTGKAVSLESLVGPKGLLVMFSCNTCPYVVKSQARTLEAINLAASRGIGVAIINSNEAQRGSDDSPQAMVAYANEQGYSVPYLMDARNVVADVFGATRTPEVFLFTSSRQLVYKGAMEDNPASPKESKKLYLKNAITNLLVNKKPDPATTRSIGCSIKRPQ